MSPAFAKILRIWMLLLLALLVVQFALAGFGVGYGGALEDGFEMHFLNGNALLYLYSTAILLSLAARTGAKIVWLTVLGSFLVLIQHGMALVNVPGTLWGQSLFLAHALNGLALIFLAHRTGVLVRNRISRPVSSRRSASSLSRSALVIWEPEVTPSAPCAMGPRALPARRSQRTGPSAASSG